MGKDLRSNQEHSLICLKANICLRLKCILSILNNAEFTFMEKNGLHLYCCIHNVSSYMSSGLLLRVFLVELASQHDPRGLNKGHDSKFRVGSQVRQKTPKEDRRTNGPKRWEYSDKDEDNSPKPWMIKKNYFAFFLKRPFTSTDVLLLVSPHFLSLSLYIYIYIHTHPPTHTHTHTHTYIYIYIYIYIYNTVSVSLLSVMYKYY